ncbi:AAA family ATPase [Candidatus Omnitrophota bacterium]
MRIISITNQKGGCGKTTTATNLAACLATNDRRVLLIDLDPQSHATLGLGVESEMSVYNVLSKSTPKRAKLKDIIKGVGKNFDLAPSSVILSALEQELTGEIGREARLRETLDGFNTNYDYILIDCPPNLGILTINAIRASGEIIIPVEASRFSLEGLNQLKEIINLIQERLNHKVKQRILLTNFDSRLRHSFTMKEKIKNSFKDRFDTIIHVNVKLKEAQNESTHILNFDKYCRGAKDYFSLSREIIIEERETPVTTGRLRKEIERIIKEKLVKMRDVTFSIRAPEAKNVHVAGEFNRWRLDEASRMDHDNGVWSKRISLRPGKYHYRFVVDGKWMEDPDNPVQEKNPFGQMDSLIKITAKPGK